MCQQCLVGTQLLSPTAGVRLLPAAPRITAQVHKGSDVASSTAAAPVSASDVFSCSVQVCGLRQHATVGAWSSIFPRRAFDERMRAPTSATHADAQTGRTAPHDGRTWRSRRSTSARRRATAHGPPSIHARAHRRRRGRRRSAFRSAKSQWREGPTVFF